MSRADKERTVADASYQGEGWWKVRLSCGHQWRVLHGPTSPRGDTVTECIKCAPQADEADEADEAEP